MHVQPAEVAPCSSLSGNTDQVPKEMHVQPADVTMCRSLSDNTDQVPKEMHVQPADVTMCRSLSDNTDQVPKEMHVQPADVTMCRSLSDNTDQVPKEMHVQPADVTMCRSLSDNTDQVPKEMHVQPADVTMCRSLSDNTDQSCEHGLVSEEMSSLEKCAICGGPLSPLKWNGERCKVTDANQAGTSQAVSENAEGKDKDPSRKVKVNEQSVSLENARRAQKRHWSPKEVAAIMRHFEGHIRKGRLATMIECKQCKTAEHPTLADRSVQNIRDFVRNRGITVKKKENF